MAQGTLPIDLNVGAVNCTTVNPTQACLLDGAIAAGLGAVPPINGQKVQHENPGVATGVELFGPAVTVAALTKFLGIAAKAGAILNFWAQISVAAVGAAVVTVDLQKSTAGGAFATVLTSVITLSIAASTNTVRTAYAAAGISVGPGVYIAGDIFQTVVTAVAGGGTLPQGLGITVLAKENPT